MTLGLLLLCVEALLVYATVFTLHTLRRRYTLIPYYAVLGGLAAALRWTADAGIAYSLGPFTFQLGSVVFFTAMLFGIFLLYVFDGVKATQLGIYVVLSLSVLVPLAAFLLQFQQTALDIHPDQQLLVAAPFTYIVSTAAMLFDFVCIAMFWECFNRYGSKTPVLLRVFVCLGGAYALDTLIYSTGTFWEDPDYGSILQGNLISRALLTALVAPLIALYVIWERRHQDYEITPRPLMAILHQSARTEMDLSVARREIQSRIQVEEELLRRDAILESLAYTAENLLALGDGLVNVGKILAALGIASNTSRVYLCENHVDGAGKLCSSERHIWSNPMVPGTRHTTTWQAVPYGETGLARWEDTLPKGEAIFGNIRTFPKEERHQLVARGVMSSLVLPIFVQQRWWGFLGLDACDGPRRWPRSEIDALRTAAVTLGAAIQRSHVEGALLESEERLELALDGGGLGLWDWNLEQRQVVFNQRFATMLGYRLEEIEPSPLAWQRLIHPEDYAEAQPILMAFLRGRTPVFEMEYRMRSKSGAWQWILNRGKVVEWSEPTRARRAIGTHLDISRLKETEEFLRFSQDMFRLMFEAAPLGFVLCQLDGTFVQANAAYLNIIGYTESEAMGLTYWDVTPKEYAAMEALQVRSMQEDGRYGPYEKEYIRKGGEHVPVLLNGSLVSGADGKEYIWSIVEDISTRKTSERALAAARQYEREFESRIEETLLRGRAPRGIEGVEIAVVSEATQHMDGDFADFVVLGPRCFDVLVGDVMGKGILAALVGAGTKSHFLRAFSAQLLAVPEGNRPSPASLVSAVHRAIVRQLIELERFLTLCYARFDLDQGKVTFVDCGHTKTIRYRVEDDSYLLLEGDNVPMGFLKEEHYHEGTVDIEPGDIFFFYSDGITEARNGDGSLFGVERLVQCLQTYANLEADDLTATVVRNVGRFSFSPAPEDDQTCVAVSIAWPMGSRGEVTRFQIAPSTSELAHARDQFHNYLATHEALLRSGDDVSNVVLAYVEALSNIMRHAKSEGDDMEVEFRAVPGRLHIAIRYSGNPFMPRQTRLPDTNKIRESGYGLYIMNRSFDHIGYDTLESGRQRITLVKYFRADNVKATDERSVILS